MSQMIIKIVDVDVQKGTTKTNKTYEFLEVSYKNMTFDGKAESKKVMPFGSKEVFATLKDAKKNDVFTLLREKNDGGFWEWVGIVLLRILLISSSACCSLTADTLKLIGRSHVWIFSKGITFSPFLIVNVSHMAVNRAIGYLSKGFIVEVRINH